MLSKDVMKFIAKSKSMSRDLLRASVQEMTVRASQPRDKGGNMPLVTGFLRNSGLGSVNQLPSGVSSPDNATATVLVINRLELGDRYYYGWVADYARFMEAKYAFLRLAQQDWQQIVFEQARKIRDGVT